MAIVFDSSECAAIGAYEAALFQRNELMARFDVNDEDFLRKWQIADTVINSTEAFFSKRNILYTSLGPVRLNTGFDYRKSRPLAVYPQLYDHNEKLLHQAKYLAILNENFSVIDKSGRVVDRFRYREAREMEAALQGVYLPGVDIEGRMMQLIGGGYGGLVVRGGIGYWLSGNESDAEASALVPGKDRDTSRRLFYDMRPKRERHRIRFFVVGALVGRINGMTPNV